MFSSYSRLTDSDLLWQAVQDGTCLVMKRRYGSLTYDQLQQADQGTTSLPATGPAPTVGERFNVSKLHTVGSGAFSKWIGNVFGQLENGFWLWLYDADANKILVDVDDSPAYADAGGVQHKWQFRFESCRWMACGRDFADGLERAYSAGEVEYTHRFLNDGGESVFLHPGDPTMQWRTSFKTGASSCVEAPGRKAQLRRMSCDVQLTDRQQRALAQAQRNASHNTLSAKEDLGARIHKVTGMRMGWQQWIPLRTWLCNDAPCIIHVKFDKELADGQLMIDKFLVDEYYRNIFETGHGGGSESFPDRDRWERNHFGSAYSGDVEAFDRPKYGCVNLTKDPLGVKSARQYGASYFVLSPAVRWRCTLTSRDSCYDDAIPATMSQTDRFLASFKDAELGAIIAKSGRATLNYAEIQIHGSVAFARDIDHLVADAALSNHVKEKVRRFAQANQFCVVWRTLS